MEQDIKNLILGDCETTLREGEGHHGGIGFAQKHEVFKEVQDRF